ncbi:hypothetical protein V8B55DRAFT_1591585 [Mucor lusitanicus]|uniref:Uncharacterized protein n=1 Tax=Mucor lusitanicus CBS 277.49 TaxID=747725 RepID=A0A168P3T5_MUCCL|nr:hypothetical protein MUCCIDRAFT_107731 [Mucor lusitanicus CBS 277.49]
MVPPNTHGLGESLIDYEQQLTDAIYLDTIKQIVEEAFDSFLEDLTAVDRDPIERLYKSIKACRADLKENTKLLKAHANLLKEMMSKVNDIRAISRDVAVKLDAQHPLKKKERKRRSPGFTKLEIDIAMDSTQKKITNYF